MKKMFYVLLALLVSMVLVFGVSCDNSNKTPGGVENLGTDKVRVPSWADGEYTGTVSVELVPGYPPIETSVGLSIHDGDFSVNVYGSDMVDSSKITDIKSQTNDEEKKIYTLEAVVNVVEEAVSEEPSETTDEKIYSSFEMKLTESGIDVKITTEDPLLSFVGGKTINFTRNSTSV